MSERRIVVDPVTRIEGHLRVQATLGDDGRIADSMSTGTMWRGLGSFSRAATRATPGPSSNASAASARAFTPLRPCAASRTPSGSRSRRTPTSCATWSMPRSTCTTIWCTYQLSALDWVDVVSALEADPRETAAIQQKNLPESSACLRGLLPRRPEPLEEVRRERPARHLQERLLGPSGHEAAARREPSCRHALS